MDPERLTAELRPRSAWEAVDFGVALARRGWAPIWGSWILLVGPVYLAIWAAFFDMPALALGLVWWLKPLFGRLTLRVVSAAVFGERLSVWRLVRELGGLWTRSLLASLLVLRLDPWRSLNMPITLLEGIGLGRQTSRRAQLRQGIEGSAGWLTLICLLIKWALFFGLIGSVFMLFPEQWGGFDDALGGLIDGRPGTRNTQIALLCADFLALMAVEPLYVAGGFGLYINRRSDLEGWDVQIGFRRLARRVAALLLLLAPLGAARAQEDPGEVAREVLQDDEFGGPRTVERYRFKEFEAIEGMDGLSCDEPAPSEGPELPGLACGRVSQGALLSLLGLALMVLVFAALRRRDLRFAPIFRSGPAPEAAAGPTLNEAILPELLVHARAAWAAGDPARALGLLYKGAVAVLREEGLPLGQGLTEGECVRLVRSRGESGVAEPFSRIARAWQLTAYAHRAPSADEFSALCEAWSKSFGRRR